MSAFSSIAGSVLDIAKNLLPVVSGGVPEVIRAAESAVKLLDKIKADDEVTNEAELTRVRDELQAEVMKHADRTIAKL